jgi:hypothetical protein
MGLGWWLEVMKEGELLRVRLEGKERLLHGRLGFDRV